MKKFISFLFIVSIAKANAQLPKKFMPVAGQYFISLPYGLTFADWLDSIYTNKAIKTDSVFELNDSTTIFLTGHILTSFPAFTKTDSITFIIGKNYGISRKSVNGSITSEDTVIHYYLSQIFFFPKDSVNDSEWKDLTKNTIKNLKKFFSVSYPTPSGNTKNRYPGEVVWFSNPGELPPSLIMRYGESQRRKDCRFIWLQLNFSIIPSDRM